MAGSAPGQLSAGERDGIGDCPRGGAGALAAKRAGLWHRPQTPPPAPDSAADLRRSLATVGTDPNNIAALVVSGRSALAMGDAQAALTFFSRADEVAPRDARIKAGMASAMTLLGQPRAALTLFAEAQSLGAPEAEIASDRGLAHDLLGDPRAAQRDYALVLRRRDNEETRRRLALSLAISGQREPALRLLEPQIRRNDRAGWRTQAFVLALTGDAAGAARVASGTGPAGAAQAMAPFLGRLPALSPRSARWRCIWACSRATAVPNMRPISTRRRPRRVGVRRGAGSDPAPPVATEAARRDERPACAASSAPLSGRTGRGGAPRRQQSATRRRRARAASPLSRARAQLELRVRTRVRAPSRPERTGPPARPAPEQHGSRRRRSRSRLPAGERG